MNAYCINKKLFLFFFFVSITFASAYAHADDEIIIYVDVDKHRNIDFFEVETYGTSWDTALKAYTMHFALETPMPHIQSGYPMNMEIYPKRSSLIIRKF